MTALAELLADDTAGDPCGPLKWKHKSLQRLSDSLGEAHPASPPTVSRLLAELGFSPKVNRKELAVSSPDRNEQFQYFTKSRLGTSALNEWSDTK